MAQGVVLSTPLPTYAPGRRDMSVRHDRLLDVAPRLLDTRFGGLFRVPGTTAVAGTPDVPVSRLTLLIDKRTKLPAKIKMSNPDGTYVFEYVGLGPWVVLTFDHTGEYNAVVADNILGTPM